MQYIINKLNYKFTTNSFNADAYSPFNRVHYYPNIAY